jgi:hypothetical protein
MRLVTGLTDDPMPVARGLAAGLQNRIGYGRIAVSEGMLERVFLRVFRMAGEA